MKYRIEKYEQYGCQKSSRGRITLCTVSYLLLFFFRCFSSQLSQPCLLGSVPPQGVMVTAATEVWATAMLAEQGEGVSGNQMHRTVSAEYSYTIYRTYTGAVNVPSSPLGQYVVVGGL